MLLRTSTCAMRRLRRAATMRPSVPGLSASNCEHATLAAALSFSHVDLDAGDMMSAREEVLRWGLDDWVELDRVHLCVGQENAGQPISVIQNKTLELIHSLVSDGMFVLGDVKRGVGFTAWNTSLDESMERIRDVYVTNFEDENTWMWFCWLDATEAWLEAARALRESQYSGQTS
jgi:hypothetical protein